MIPLEARLLAFVETELLADFPPCDVAGELQQLSEELVPGWQGSVIVPSPAPRGTFADPLEGPEPFDMDLVDPPPPIKQLKPRRKLTAEIARSVRSSTDTGKELAARFGVSQATISQIRRGHTWRDA